VITSLSLEQLEPYAFALQDLPVVHKSNLVTELPEVLATCIGQLRRGAAKA
jgi:hypothetical protein